MTINANLAGNIMVGQSAAALNPKLVSGFYAVDNLRAIQRADLASPQIFEKVALFVRDLDDDGAGFRAKECLEILINLLEQNESLSKTDPNLFRDYLNLLLILKANCFGLMEYKDVAQFLEEQALLALSIPFFVFRELGFLFDLKEKVYSYIKFDAWYLNEDTKKDMVKAFITAIEKNQEYLGEEMLKIEGRPLLDPIMQNWILDYNESVHPSFGKRNSFDRSKYFNTSSQVAKLGPNQKTVLDNFFKFYDWLKFESEELVHNDKLKILNQLVNAEEKKQKNIANTDVVKSPAVEPLMKKLSMQDVMGKNLGFGGIGPRDIDRTNNTGQQLESIGEDQAVIDQKLKNLREKADGKRGKGSST